jgi:DNA ligase 1
MIRRAQNPVIALPCRVYRVCRVCRFALLLLLGALWSPASHADERPPALLLAQVYSDESDNIDITHYLVSEKLDGVRAVWDGHQLRYRSGRVVPAPAWFLAGLPSVPLDGELWLGRGRFDELSAGLRRDHSGNLDESLWRAIRYCVFELPEAKGHFAERATALQTLVKQQNTPWLTAIEQRTLSNRAQLKAHFKTLIAAGAEGLMLHRADALYETGRSPSLLKLKPANDAEAEVIGYVPGKGKYAGQTGALRLRMPSGQTFALGSGLSDELRRNPPPLGTRITYRYQELTAAGRPRFPRYWRERVDF